jgi:hypothetical protein
MLSVSTIFFNTSGYLEVTLPSESPIYSCSIGNRFMHSSVQNGILKCHYGNILSNGESFDVFVDKTLVFREFIAVVPLPRISHLEFSLYHVESRILVLGSDFNPSAACIYRNKQIPTIFVNSSAIVCQIDSIAGPASISVRILHAESDILNFVVLSEFLVISVTPSSINSGNMVSLTGGRFNTNAHYDVLVGSSGRKFSAVVESFETLVFRPDILDTGNFSITVCSQGKCMVHCCLRIFPQLSIQSFQPKVLMNSFDSIAIRCLHSASVFDKNIFCFNGIPGTVTDVVGEVFYTQVPSVVSPGNILLSVCNGHSFGYLKYVQVYTIFPSVIFHGFRQIITVTGLGFSYLSSILGGTDSRTLHISETSAIIGSTWSNTRDYVSLHLDGQLWNSTIILSTLPKITHSKPSKSLAIGSVTVTLFGHHFDEKFHFRCLFGTEAVESRFLSTSSILCSPWTSSIPGNTTISVHAEGYSLPSNSISFQVGYIPCIVRSDEVFVALGTTARIRFSITFDFFLVN